jgi:hypothetical protein
MSTGTVIIISHCCGINALFIKINNVTRIPDEGIKEELQDHLRRNGWCIFPAMTDFRKPSISHQ